MNGKLLHLTSGFACLAAALGFARGEEAKPDAAPVFTPQVSDFMNETQLRHFKLWYSGSLRNWALARYEIEKMKTSFDLAEAFAAKAYPNFHDLLKADAEPAFKALDAAIAGKNEAAFVEGFGQLTKSCNACHASVGLGFIKLQTPSASPFSDQNLGQ